MMTTEEQIRAIHDVWADLRRKRAGTIDGEALAHIDRNMEALNDAMKALRQMSEYRKALRAFLGLTNGV